MRKEIKILHTADLHLTSVKNELYDTFIRILHIAENEKVDYLLISGDLFDDKNIDLSFAEKISSLFSKLHCNIYITPGNHDPYTPDSVYASGIWPLNVHIFKDKFSIIEHDDIRIYGKAFTGHFQNESMLNTEIYTDDRYINILVMHADTDMNSAYNPISLSRLKELNFDYVALGHVHEYINCYPHYVYPGIPQGRGFDELGECGIAIGYIYKGKYDISFIPVCEKKYILKEIDISDMYDSLVIAEFIKNTISKDNNMYKIILTGSVKETPDVKEIKNLILPYYNNIKVSDSTQPYINIAILKNENTLKGIFVRNMLDKIKKAPDNKILLEALNLGIKAFDEELKENIEV